MRVTPRFRTSGSLLAGTVENQLVDVTTALEVEADVPREQIAELVRAAERMCYMLDVIRQPHDVRGSVTLNGQPL